MKKLFYVCMILAVLSSCKNEEQDMRVKLVDGVLELLESKGFSCDTSYNDVTCIKSIVISQKELVHHYLPAIQSDYDEAYNKVLKDNNAQEGDATVYLEIGEIAETNLAEKELFEKVYSLADSIQSYISTFTSLQPNFEDNNETSFLGFRWVYDNFQCEISIYGEDLSSNYRNCKDLTINIALTSDYKDEENHVEFETTSQDPCVALIKTLYEDYVLLENADTREIKPFELVVDDMFTQKGKQKLIDGYEYELEPGEVGYELDLLRTGVQDSDGNDVANVGVKEILPLGDNKYLVKYFDMGFLSETMLSFVEEGGKLKIDDFKTDTRNYDLAR